MDLGRFMKDTDKATSWYNEKQSLFESLANKVADIIKENVEENKVQYHSVSSRRKSLESFTAKAKEEKYTDPVNQIKDMAGVRVITYLETDVSRVDKIVEELFDIDWSNSVDQSRLLGSNVLGYRSVHYVAKFDQNRCKLPEYERYKDLPFEIQVRSLLQHAWAEFAHDRNYKFGGKLPTKLERRFYLVAGMLEIADREFGAIATKIDKYVTEVRQVLRRGHLDIEITTASLTEYLTSRFSRLAKIVSEESRYTGDKPLVKTIVEELELFGISTLDQLDKIIPKELEDKMLALPEGQPRSLVGVARAIVMISDIKKYFMVSWRTNWKIISESRIKLLGEYGIDRSYLEKHVNIVPDDQDTEVSKVGE